MASAHSGFLAALFACAARQEQNPSPLGSSCTSVRFQAKYSCIYIDKAYGAERTIELP